MSKPYLAIRNWSKFQASSKTGNSLPWCKLYSAQADDFEYQRLTGFQRGVLHDCYLVVTRTARNLHNDITWLARTMHTLGTDRPHLQHAIDTLTSRGFLTPTESAELTCRGEESDGENESESEWRGRPKTGLVVSQATSPVETKSKPTSPAKTSGQPRQMTAMEMVREQQRKAAEAL